MSFEQKLEKRFGRLEVQILERLARIEAAYEERMNHLEREIHRLARQERRTDREVDEIEREVDEIERELRPHHYPATTGITIKPA